ncbi:hypothetical protein HUN92_22525 [Bacillus firmus]|uniref:hypothetical protein n=1 Tax=Cytobacillus firmus TaxID=1399 RepID=UPI0015806A02|nr:hypothetical protein [Cytobacillus firmus]MBG9654096.1 hypothetical protein [Cytobacillus firmus]MED1908851.1 hypothetical protein [Cytobacillus firmus]NUH86414.1 hypothetical protein [Cytobacillus firmus]
MGSYLNRVRKRYTVTIEAKGEVQQIVVIAYTPKAMLRVVHRLYGHLLTNEDGIDTGQISYQETELL